MKAVIVTRNSNKALQLVTRPRPTLLITARPVVYRERVEIGAQVVEYPQDIPSMVWTVLHNLGRKPGVQVLVGGETVLADVKYIDLNTIQVEFAAPQSGSTLII